MNINKLRLTFIPLFMLILFSTKAQDRIINTNQDTILCKILYLNSDRILYEIKNTDGSINGHSLSFSQIAEYTRSSQSEVNSNIAEPAEPKSSTNKQTSWTFGLNIGQSIMPWYFDHLESTSERQDYYNDLKKGYHINANLYYKLKDNLGIGAEYSFLVAETNGNTQIDYSSYLALPATEKIRQYINYIGPSVLLQQYLDKQHKIRLRGSLSAGLVFFRLENEVSYPYLSYDTYTEYAENSLITGNPYAAKIGLALDYKLFKCMSIGLSGDYIWCSMDKVSTEIKGSGDYSYSSESQKLDKAMNLSRFDYSIVLQFQF